MPRAAPPPEPAAPRLRRTRTALFALLFVCYAWFHPGGGWNQNVRFAQVRAIAEQGRLAVDDQLFYTLAVGEDGVARQRRIPLSRESAPSARLPRAVSLDLSEHAEHLYPNKPPGLSLLALPGYLAARVLLAPLSRDADDAFALNLALYLTSVLSVGLLCALGGVLFHDVTRRLFPRAPPRARLAATLAYGLGTPVFAYATFLIDHAVVATLCLAAFRALLVAREGGPRSARALFAAGGLVGLAVLANQSAALCALAFGIYALAVLPQRRRVGGYLAGGLAPALALGAYQWLCFGHPLDLPQDHQLGMFQTGAPLLGIFSAPRWELLPRLWWMPYRGLFFWSPVLLLGLLALPALLRERRLRPEALLCAGLFLAFSLMNASFNAWHGGGTFGPRYLVPALPFLALPLVWAFQRAPRVSALVAAASAALMLLVNAVGPQLDAGLHRPLSQFYLPLALGGQVESGGFRLRGPVSVHPAGFVGPGLESLDGGHGARWGSFNLGELVFPESWLSLAPLAVAATLIAGLAAGGAPPRRSG